MRWTWKKSSLVVLLLITLLYFSPEVNSVVITILNITSYTGVQYNNTISSQGLPLIHALTNDSSLVLYMPFDVNETNNKFSDYGPYGNNGTCSGATCPTLNATGKYGGAYDFDGANDYINVLSSANYKSNTQAFSLWVYPVKLPTSNYNGLIAIWDGNANSFEVFIDSGTSNIVAGSYPWTMSYTLPATNRWYHIYAETVDNNGKLYVDGVYRSNGSVTYNAISNAGDLQIGSRQSTVYPFNGSIDDVMIFNRSLSATEVSAVYNQTYSKFYQPAIAYIPANESMLGNTTVNVTMSSVQPNGSTINISLLLYGADGSYINRTTAQILPNGTSQKLEWNITSLTNRTNISIEYFSQYYTATSYGTILIETGGGEAEAADTTPPIWLNLTNTSTLNSSTRILVITDEATNLTFTLYTNSSRTAPYAIFNMSNSTLSTTKEHLVEGLLNSTTYFFAGNISDSSGNGAFNETFNFTTARNIIAADSISPGFSSFKTAPAAPVSYSKGASYLFNVTLSETGNTILAMNSTNTSGTNFSNEWSFTRTDLGAGEYEYFFYANDTTGNRNTSQTFNYSITRANSSLALTFNATSPQTYSAEIRATCNINAGEASITFTRNGTAIANNSVQSLAAGVYLFNCSLAASQNFTETYNASFFTIESDIIAPTWANNNTNASSKINDVLYFAINWSDSVNLSRYTFSWNGTGGSFQNDSSVAFANNLGTAFSNVTKTVNRVRGEVIGWRFYVNDTSGNMNVSDIFTFVVLNTPASTPTIQNPTQNANLTAVNISINADNPDNDTLTYTIYANGVLNITTTTNITVWNASFMQYTLNISVSDVLTSSNNATVSFNYSAAQDTQSPSWQSNSTNASGRINDILYFYVNWTDITLSRYTFFWNGTNGGALVNDSSAAFGVANVTKTIGLSRGNTIGWGFYANDTAGNMNVSDTFMFVVLNTPPTIPIISSPGANSINSTIKIEFTATDADNDALTYSIYVNGTLNITSASNVTTWNASDGSYAMNISVSDGFASSANTSRDFSLDASAPNVVASVCLPTSPVTYSKNAAIYCNTTITDINFGSVSLQANGTNYSASLLTGIIYNTTAYDLGVGTHTLTWNANDTTGNRNGTQTVSYTIDQANSSLALTFNATSSTFWGADFLPRCVVNAGETAITLMRNGTSIANNSVQQLAAGIYNFNCSMANSWNYTSTHNASFFTVDKISTSVQLYLNYSRTNLVTEIVDGEQFGISFINVTNSNLTGLNVSLYVNTTLNYTNTTPYNLSLVFPKGYWNITAVFAGNENRSESRESWFFNVSDSVPPGFRNFKNIIANASAYASGVSYSFNVTTSESSTTILNFNGTNYTANSAFGNESSFTIPFTLSAANYTLFYYSNDSAGNRNTSQSFNYLVNTANSSLLLTFNVSSPISWPYEFLVRCNANTGTADQTLSRDGVTITNNSVQSLAAATYVFNCSVPASQNFTSTYNSSSYVINKQNVNVSLYLNYSRANIAYNGSKLLQVNVSAINLSSANNVTLYINGTANYTNSTPFNLTLNLPDGFYNLTAKFLGNQNKSASEEMWTALSNVTTLLNSSMSLTFNATSPLTYLMDLRAICNMVVGDGTASLTRNGTSITNNSVQSLAAGDYLFNCSMPQTGTYNPSHNSSIFTINKRGTNISLYLNYSRGNVNLNLSAAMQFNVSAINLTANHNASLYINGSLNYTNSTPFNFTLSLAAGFWTISTNFSGDENYSLSREEWTANITDNRSLSQPTQISNPDDDDDSGSNAGSPYYSDDEEFPRNATEIQVPSKINPQKLEKIKEVIRIPIEKTKKVIDKWNGMPLKARIMLIFWGIVIASSVVFLLAKERQKNKKDEPGLDLFSD